MEVIKVAIIEDDVRDAEELKTCIVRFAKEEGIDIQASVYSDALLFLSGYRPVFSIVFLDIEMPDMDGLEAAKELRGMDKNVALVFVTNMPQYAVNGYEFAALDYILKPLNYPNFVFKMKRIMNAVAINSEKEITIPLTNGISRVSSNTLLYVEAVGHKMKYHLISETIDSHGVLSSVEKKLSHWHFLRCNKCYLVNPMYIEWVRGYTVKVGNEELQISRPRRKGFLQGLSKWLAGGGR